MKHTRTAESSSAQVISLLWRKDGLGRAQSDMFCTLFCAAKPSLTKCHGCPRAVLTRHISSNILFSHAWLCHQLSVFPPVVNTSLGTKNKKALVRPCVCVCV